MDFKETMAAEVSSIEKEIDLFFRREIENSLESELTRDILHSLKRYTLKGGKRVRGTLVVMGYRAVGGKDIPRIRAASVGLELIQSMLLIHDDIIDRSPERRGGDSFHVEYSKAGERRGLQGDPERFGENIAIISGDLAEAFGEKAVLKSGFPPDRIKRALEAQADMIRDTGFGQILDIYSGELDKWEENDVLMVHKYKTAIYTFEGPLHIGANLNGASVEKLKALSDYAIPAGIAFQLIDDILGLFGDPKRGGEEDLADIKEGKMTLLIVKALEMAEKGDVDFIKKTLGRTDLTTDQARRFRSIIENCGSVGYSRDLAKEYSSQALNALDEDLLDEEVIEFLRGFTEYLMKRA